MRLVSWNVNSIRARHDQVVRWLHDRQPDTVALQETKCTDKAFAALATDYESLGYEWAHWGLDHWNGVAILSRVGLCDIKRGFGGTNRPPFDEARLLSATCSNIRCHSIYVPNGRTLDDPHYLYKLVWLERLRSVIDPNVATAALGDFNVAPSDADIYDPRRWRNKTHASPQERQAIASLIDLGLVDAARAIEPTEPRHTWWSYRPGQFDADNGLRIDLALLSTDLEVASVWVDRQARSAPKPSDHAPLIVEIS